MTHLLELVRFAAEAWLILCLVSTPVAFVIWGVEERSYNRQVRRQARRDQLRYRTAADQRRRCREYLEVIGGSGGRR